MRQRLGLHPQLPAYAGHVTGLRRHGEHHRCCPHQPPRHRLGGGLPVAVANKMAMGAVDVGAERHDRPGPYLRRRPAHGHIRRHWPVRPRDAPVRVGSFLGPEIREPGPEVGHRAPQREDHAPGGLDTSRHGAPIGRVATIVVIDARQRAQRVGGRLQRVAVDGLRPDRRDVEQRRRGGRARRELRQLPDSVHHRQIPVGRRIVETCSRHRPRSSVAYRFLNSSNILVKHSGSFRLARPGRGRVGLPDAL